MNDTINAGSAVRATLADLLDCGAALAALASLLTLGEAAAQIAAPQGAPFFTPASLARGMRAPDACPLRTAGVPLTGP
jgi:orotate phosphoribosyltransferase